MPKKERICYRVVLLFSIHPFDILASCRLFRFETIDTKHPVAGIPGFLLSGVQHVRNRYACIKKTAPGS